MTPADVEDRDAYIEAVLSLVEQIPAGRVMTYGSIADLIGRGGPRQVGRVMALHGGGVAWWRVVRSDGSLPDSHHGEAVARYHQEGTALRGRIADADTLRVDVASALWSPTRSA